MKRVVFILCATAFALAPVATSAATAAPAKVACTPGVIKINGVSARKFCGPAKATVHLGSKVVAYAGGQCSKSSFGFVVNIGTVVLGKVKNMPEYFGLTTTTSTTGTHDGSIAVNHAGKGAAVTHAAIVLKAGLKSGTFSGKVFGSPTRITGTFTC